MERHFHFRAATSAAPYAQGGDLREETVPRVSRPFPFPGDYPQYGFQLRSAVPTSQNPRVVRVASVLQVQLDGISRCHHLK